MCRLNLISNVSNAFGRLEIDNHGLSATWSSERDRKQQPARRSTTREAERRALSGRAGARTYVRLLSGSGGGGADLSIQRSAGRLLATLSGLRIFRRVADQLDDGPLLAAILGTRASRTGRSPRRTVPTRGATLTTHGALAKSRQCEAAARARLSARFRGVSPATEPRPSRGAAGAERGGGAGNQLRAQPRERLGDSDRAAARKRV